jgi:hypothetical protein
MFTKFNNVSAQYVIFPDKETSHVLINAGPFPAFHLGELLRTFCETLDFDNTKKSLQAK